MDEPDRVGEHGAAGHDRDDSPPEPPMQRDGPRAHDDDDEVHREEPQRTEGHSRPRWPHPAEQRHVAPQTGTGRRADVQQVQGELDHGPDAEEEERRA